MIRSELINAIAADEPWLTRSEIGDVLTVFFDTICERLEAGGRVELRGFGAFSTRGRDPRAGRNPRTGEAVDVSAKRVPFFKAGKELRERVDQR
ncbi:MAG: integration host factor subunit beta [Sphingomonas sp.]